MAGFTNEINTEYSETDCAIILGEEDSVCPGDGGFFHAFSVQHAAEPVRVVHGQYQRGSRA
jgi:hypothetical protein